MFTEKKRETRSRGCKVKPADLDSPNGAGDNKSDDVTWYDVNSLRLRNGWGSFRMKWINCQWFPCQLLKYSCEYTILFGGLREGLATSTGVMGLLMNVSDQLIAYCDFLSCKSTKYAAYIVVVRDTVVTGLNLIKMIVSLSYCNRFEG